MTDAASATEATARRGVSLTDRTYATLRHRIITGEMAPGQIVSELELAEALSVSKTPVREALARLGVEGLVEAFPRRGYRITSVTVKDLNDLFAVRALLEGEAAALACTAMDEGGFAELRELARATYEPGESLSVQSFVAANERFHSAIARASGNPRLGALVRSHLEEGARFFYMGTRLRDVNPETREDHYRIVEVLRRQDPEAARAIMVEHIENTRRGLLTAIVTDGRGAFSL